MTYNSYFFTLEGTSSYKKERGIRLSTDNQLLDVQNLHTGFRIKDDYYDAVDGVSFTLERNEILAIVGESGCGKSTLATTIMGLHDPNNTKITGEILYKDLNLSNLN